ncbi:MAG: hypothetical protein ACRD2L_16490 [Terriglobia bacterium]
MKHLLNASHKLCVKRFMVRDKMKQRNSHTSSFFIQQAMNTTPSTFFLSLSLSGCNVTDIDLHGRSLLNQAEHRRIVIQPGFSCFPKRGERLLSQCSLACSLAAYR